MKPVDNKRKKKANKAPIEFGKTRSIIAIIAICSIPMAIYYQNETSAIGAIAILILLILNRQTLVTRIVSAFLEYLAHKKSRSDDNINQKPVRTLAAKTSSSKRSQNAKKAAKKPQRKKK